MKREVSRSLRYEGLTNRPVRMASISEYCFDYVIRKVVVVGGDGSLTRDARQLPTFCE